MSTPDEQTGRPLTRRELRELRAKGVDSTAPGPEQVSPTDDAPERPATAPEPPAEQPAKVSQKEQPAKASQQEQPAKASQGEPAAEPSAKADPAPRAHPPLTRKEMRQLRTNELPVVSAELPAEKETEAPPLTQPDTPVSTTVFEMPKLDPAFGAGVGTSTTRDNTSFDSLMEQGPTTSPSSILMTSSHRLPDGIGSTGAAHGTTDGRDIDAVLIDGELPAASSPTPIAASSAISTQKSAAEVLRPPTPEKGRNLLLVLGITAGALGIVAVGTLATLYFTGAFN